MTDKWDSTGDDVPCQHCGEHRGDEMFYLQTLKQLCRDCLEHYRCERCNELFEGGSSLCRKCWKETQNA